MRKDILEQFIELAVYYYFSGHEAKKAIEKAKKEMGDYFGN